MYNKFKAYFFIAILEIIVGCSKAETGKTVDVTDEKASSVPVTVIEVTNSDYYEYGEYYGRTKGIKSAEIFSVAGGKVEEVTILEGTIVEKGESLGKIATRGAEITLESAKLNEKISAENYRTLKDFLKKGNSTPLNVDQAHLNWLNSQSMLIDAQKVYDGAFCITPISGVVVTRNINTDEEILPGHNTFLVEDLSKIEIQIGIPESDMEGIKEGSKAQITMDLFPGRVWDGVLTRYSRKSSDRNLTFSAVVIVDNSDGTILSGTTAKVKLLRKSFTNSIVVPTDVVVNNNSGNYVMVLKNNIVTKKDVIIGASDEDRCVILNGVEKGDFLIEEGLYLLEDSQAVTVISEGV